MEIAYCATRPTFAYIWTIEGFSDLTYINFKSPSFVVKSMGDTVWHLRIEEKIGFYCYIESNIFSEEESDGIDFEFSFLGTDGSPLVSKKSSNPRMFLKLMNAVEVLKRRPEFILNNTLTVRCRMWKREYEIPTDVCYARTKLNTYAGSFIWAIEEFSSLPCSNAENFRTLSSEERKVHPLKPLTQKGPFMALILYLKQGLSENESVRVKFLIEKPRDYGYSCKISILNKNGTVFVTHVKRSRTDYDWTFFTFPPLIWKPKLHKNLLSNDTLVLRCSFEVCTGFISNELEYFTPNVSAVAKGEPEVLNVHVLAAEANNLLEFEEYFVK